MADGADPSVDLAAGSTLGPYRLEEKIARGGMAEIWSAIPVDGSGRLALKVLSPQFARDPVFRAMFSDEVAIASRLHHDNVVRVHGAYDEDGHVFLAMELLDGKDLRRLLSLSARSDQAVPVPIALAIARGMARGLAHAHGLTNDAGRLLDVVHRDVSPHNVLITRDGQVKMLDFGIARAAERLTRTRTGVIKGKVAYMAPEQALAVGVTPQTDIFAVGVVLWEMLAMQRLFRAATDAESLELVVRAEVPPIRGINGKVPPMAAELLHRMLALRAPDRPSSMADVADRLDRIINANFTDQAPKPEVLAAWVHGLVDEERADTLMLPVDVAGPVEVPHVSRTESGVLGDAAGLPDNTEPNQIPPAYLAPSDDTTSGNTPVPSRRVSVPPPDDAEAATIRPDLIALGDDTSGNTPVIQGEGAADTIAVRADPRFDSPPPSKGAALPSFVAPTRRGSDASLPAPGAPTFALTSDDRGELAAPGAPTYGLVSDQRAKSEPSPVTPVPTPSDPTPVADTSAPTEAVAAIDVQTMAVRTNSRLVPKTIEDPETPSTISPALDKVRLPTRDEIRRAVEEQATVPVQADPRFVAPVPRVVTPPPPDDEEATIRAPSRPPIDPTAVGPLVAPLIPAAPVKPLDPDDPSGAFVRIDPSAQRRPPSVPIIPPPPEDRVSTWLPYATVGLMVVVVVLVVLLFVKG